MKVFRAFLVLFILIGIIHVFVHLSVYGTGINNFYPKGVSGLAIGDLSINDNFKEKNPEISSWSLRVIYLEWGIVLFAAILFVITKNLSIRREIESIKTLKNASSSKNKTDLDSLYDIINQKGSIKVSSAAKIFKVEKNTIMNWGEILESGNLATIQYPNVGEPEIKKI